MKKIILLFLLTITFQSLASDSIFKGFKNNQNPTEKDEKTCLDHGGAIHKAKFYKSELCNYGAESCEIGDQFIEPFEVLCDLEKVTECYDKKAWLNRNQYFGLSQTLTVTNISNSFSFINGKEAKKTCAHYK